MYDDQLERIFRIPSLPPPRPKGKHRVGDLAQYLQSENAVFRSLAEERLAASAGLKDALSQLAESIAADPDGRRKGWEASAIVEGLMREVSNLPSEVGEGHMKLRGYLPARVDRGSSLKYAALIVAFSTRALFLAERRGFDSLLSSVDSRGRQYAQQLPDSYALVISGFPALYSTVQSAELADAVSAFSISVLGAFGPSERAYAAVCTTFAFLVSCGAAGSSPASREPW